MNSVGNIIEERACQFLTRQGLQFIAKNVRFKVGELDLVMQQGDMLVFVEVRYRAYSSYGSGLESISWSKKQKIRRAAECYLLKNSWARKMPCRVDAISVSGPLEKLCFEWVENI